MLEQKDEQSPLPTRKNRGDFWLSSTAKANSSRFAAEEDKTVERYTKFQIKCNHGIPFWKWEISLVHITCGYSGPGMLGEFVVVLLMWCLGAPSILISMLLFILKSVHEYFRKIFEVLTNVWIINYVVKINLFTKLLPLCLGSTNIFRIVIVKKEELNNEEG